MTSIVQVAVGAECTRMGGCARRMQCGVDAFYAPSRPRGKCASAPARQISQTFLEVKGPFDVTA